MFEFVSATRKSRKDFWENSFLGKCLYGVENDMVKVTIAYENSSSLSKIYNNAIKSSNADYLIFLHDDVFINDSDFFEKITRAHDFYQVVGVVGCLTPAGAPPSWLFSDVDMKNQKFLKYHEVVGGTIHHGSLEKSEVSRFGSTPHSAFLIDGVFISVKRTDVLSQQVFFDESFDFDFYDLDFCKSAVKSGLKIGIWPIDLIHQSVGDFFSDRWIKSFELFKAKWSNL